MMLHATVYLLATCRNALNAAVTLGGPHCTRRDGAF